MAESRADICNLALTFIGHTEYLEEVSPASGSTASTTDETEAGRIADQNYVDTLKLVLRAFNWPFATERQRPAQIDDTTLALGEVPGDWTYAYMYPVEWVKLRRIYPGVRNPRDDQETPHAIERDATLEARIILTDDDEPELVGTAFVDDPTQYPSDFVNALAWALAIKFAAGLRKDVKTTQLAAAGYASALGEAAANARLESPGDRLPDPEWIANR